MNQHQRKFLLDEITNQYRRERGALDKRKPHAPSLNNYLVAAILDGSATMRPMEEVRETIRRRVRDLGKGESLVTSSSSRYGRFVDDEDDIQSLTISALTLFVEPPEYAARRAEYLTELAKWEAESQMLEDSAGAMKIKIQVGSDKALETLVDQADKICTMSLRASSRLLLASDTGKEPQ